VTVVRDATRADLPEILDIYNDAVLTTLANLDIEAQTIAARVAWFEEHEARGLPVLVAEEVGRVAGWASLGTYRPRPGYRFTLEDSVYVARGAQGRGVGRELLAELLRRAEALPCRVVLAGIDATNAASLRLHASLGFEEVARLRDVGWKLGRWCDVVYMERRFPFEAGVR
jgi:phosphinothricin acetyltransferase